MRQTSRPGGMVFFIEGAFPNCGRLLLLNFLIELFVVDGLFLIQLFRKCVEQFGKCDALVPSSLLELPLIDQ